jgi:PAS domain S-box-containing protein
MANNFGIGNSSEFDQFHPDLLKKIHKFSITASIIVFFTGVIVIAGWCIDNNILKSVLPGFASMKVNTAILFILLGLSLWLFNKKESGAIKSNYALYIAKIFSCTATIISILELCQYIFNWNLHIDELLFKDVVTYNTLVPPGRMAPVTAFNLLLAGISLFVIWNDKTINNRFSQSAAIIIFAFSSLALIGYLYNVQSLYKFVIFSAIALHTAILFILLSLGILAARPHRSFMRTFSGNKTGSMMVRKLLPYVIGIPIIVGWLRLAGQKTGYYNLEFGTSLMVISCIILPVIVLIWNARSINTIEIKREDDREKLLRAEDEIELYNNAPCGYHSIDADGLIVEINQTELNWFQYTREEIIGKKRITEFLTPESKIIFRNTYDLFKERGYLNGLEMEFTRKDGSTFPVLLNSTAIKDKAGNYLRSRSTIIDHTEQKKYQKSILEANKRFSKAFFASPLAMAITSITGFYFSDVNERFLELFEYSRDEVIGQSANGLQILVSADDLSKIQSLTKEKDLIYKYETKMKTKSGKIVDVNFSSTVVEIDGINYHVSMIIDITQRKRSEEELNNYRLHLEQIIEERSKELNEQSKQYQLIFEGNPLPMWVCDVETFAFLAVNDSAVSKYQYTREEFLSMNIKDIRPVEEIPKLIEAVNKTTDGILTGIWRHQKKDGSLIDVEINSHFVTFEGKKAVLILANDVTERKMTEKALFDAEKRFRTTLDSMLEGCQIIDYNYSYIYLNEVAARHGHSTIKQLYGLTMLDTYPGIEQTPFFVQLKRCMIERLPHQMENEFVYPDGSSSWFYLSLEPVPEGVFILSEDITKEKQLNEEVIKYREHLEELVAKRTAQLEEANKELESFSYSVSHDLRAPLRHITGFIQILQKEIEADLNEKNKKYFGYISESADKMGVLIDDLLSFSRMGRVEMENREVNLENMIKDVIDDFKLDIQNRDIKWIIEKLPLVKGDPSMLRQVLFNLISNAIKFTRHKDITIIEVGVKTEGDEYIFYVKDNGAGFDIKYVDKLFGVFQRLHRYDEFEGTGIGLAIIKRIVNRHGGRVWAEGDIDKGAAIYFTLHATEGN